MLSVPNSLEKQKSKMDINFEFDFSNPKTAHDFVIIVDKKKFYVNSGILSVWSETFTDLFKKKSTEKKDLSVIEAGNPLFWAGPLRNLLKPKPTVSKVREINLENLSSEDFKNFLMVVYPVDFNVSVDNYKGLIGLAFRFFAPAVLQQCKKFIEKEFNNLDAFELLELAIQYQLEDVKEKLVEFFKKDKNIVNCSGNGHSFAQHIFCPICNANKLTYLEANRNRIADLSIQAKAFVLRIICNI